jgi:hypothetical protein
VKAVCENKGVKMYGMLEYKSMKLGQSAIENAEKPRGRNDIDKNPIGIPRKNGRSLIVDHKRGRPAGTLRSAQEIANQKASIAKSREAGTWRSGRFKPTTRMGVK